jgi:ABC-type branched-subunit amino acid transport system ATPase component/branched-subunit amino acid ABC-type transport system permease component
VANDILKFAILGFGAGAVYAITALGVVLVYRGSGVVNFAHGAIGMVGAFIFYNQRESGTSTAVCWVLALGFALLLGAAIHLLVMRPLRRAPGISRLVATLGIFAILFAWAHQRYGDSPRIVAKLLPVENAVEVLPAITIGEDRLILLAIGVLLTAVLTLVYRYTRFGLSTSAVAESRRATSAQGISPDVIATVNWALGSMLGVLAAVLVVNIAGLSVIGLTLLIVPALAAALVGGFRSFPLTLLGGLLIGVLQSEIAWLQTYLTQQEGHIVTLDGWAESVPFLVIIVVLVVLGRSLPLRGEASEHPPEVGSGRIRPVVLVPAVAIAVVLISFVFSTTVVEAVTTSAALGVIVLSLVVVTGFTGQLSLAQFALAGTGGWIAAALVANEGAPFWLAALCGVLGAVPVGVLVGLPSLRTRGVNLAVATLGLAVVIQAWILGNAGRTGGFTGLDIGVPDVFGFDLDPLHHPQRYAFAALALLTAAGICVANLRRGRAGRRLVAVRSNERAAASLGISVFGAKLYAFGLSAAIAGVGGVIIVFRRPTAVFLPTFSIFESIFVVIYAVIGGVGFVLGSVIGGAIAPGAFVTNLFGDVFGETETVQIALGFVLIIVLLVVPDGLASLPRRIALAWRARSKRPPERPIELPAEVPREPVRPATLELLDVSVRFGGVVALDGLSIAVRPGEVVGLIGPNGAGKTTCIDAATGFVRSTGEIRLDGVRVDRWSPRRRAAAGIGRSFQTLELFESLTVLENLRVASEPRDLHAYFTDLLWPRRAELAPTAVAAVREFGLEPDLDRRPDELPYGRRRLVAIARAVAAEPSVLFLDEPAAGLSDDETRELGGLIRRLARDWGLAILLVEHDVALVLDVCDRVVVLDDGRHLAEGTPDEVRHSPAVVAAYLGEPVEGPPEEPEPVATAVSTGRGAPEPSHDERLVSARGLAAGYGDLAAVRDLDLDVHPGEVVALLGPNGAGKTTTLLTIAGELSPLAGEVRCLDLPRRAPLHRRVRRGLAFVPEERAVFTSLSVSGNLRLRRGATADATELFPELEPLLRRRAGLLSGGEQQMLTLGRALAGTPRLLLVDELSLGLAPLVLQRLLLAVRAAADRGVGVLLVEQHASEALSIADRALVLRRGRVALEGSAADLRTHISDLESAYLSGLDDDPDEAPPRRGEHSHERA